jgi:hypothetical protein
MGSYPDPSNPEVERSLSPTFVYKFDPPLPRVTTIDRGVVTIWVWDGKQYRKEQEKSADG